MTTHGDMIYALGGVPVLGGGNRFHGWYGRNIYFVDYDNGSDDNDGTDIDYPVKNVHSLLHGLTPESTIYIRNRQPTTGSDEPQKIPTGTSTGHLVVQPHSYFTSIIGASPAPLSAQGAFHTYLRPSTVTGSSGSTTGPVLAMMGFGACVENLAFHKGCVTTGTQMRSSQLGLYGSTGGGYLASMNAHGTDYGANKGRAHGSVVNNCLFRWEAPGTGINAAIIGVDLWYCQFINNHFYNCGRGIQLRGVGMSAPRECQIRNNTFSGDAASWSVDIVLYSSNMRGNIVHGNIFSHPIPTGTSGSVSLKYFAQVGSDTGSMVSNNWFNATSAEGDYTLITNTLGVGNYDGDTAMLT